MIFHVCFGTVITSGLSEDWPLQKQKEYVKRKTSKIVALKSVAFVALAVM